MRKSAIVLAILSFFVLAGLILLPALVDLNRWKPQIAAQLSAETGRTVELAGPLSLALLPDLAVTARDVRLANPPGAAAKDMVRLRALEVKPAFWPLLRREFEIRSARLIEPEIDLERLADGEGNWHFTASPAPPGDVLILALEQLRIENGAVTYRSPRMVERFEHINAAVTLAGPNGPFDTTGTLVSHGAGFTFALRSGALDAAEVPLRVSLSANPAAELDLDALLTGEADDRQIRGRLKLTTENFQALATTLARAPVPAALAQSLALAGEVKGSSRALMLEPMGLDLGTAHGEGSLSLGFGEPMTLALRLSLPRLDVDDWTASHKTALAPLPAPPRASAVAPADPTAPLPLQPPPAAAPAIRASIELGVDATRWRGGFIRNARLKASLADGALTVDRLSALLPGNTDLSISGSGALDADPLRAQGVAQANADDLRSLLGWLGLATDGVPADRLRKALLSTRFALDGERLDLGDIDASLDTTRLTGAATVALRERPGIGLRLAADRFNLDAYLPRAAATPPAAAAPSAGDGMLAGFDANLDMRVAALTWHGEPLGDVHLAGTWQKGDLSLRELSVADIGGASAELSGAIAGLSSETRKGQLTYEVHGPELEHALRVLSPGLAAGRFYGEFRLHGDVHSDGDSLALQAALDLLGGHAELAGKVAAGGEGDLALDLEHPSFAGLLHQLTPAYQPTGDPGAVKLSAHVAGTLARPNIDRLALSLGQSTLEGSVALRMDEARPHVAADLKLGDWRLDELMPRRQTADLGARFPRAALTPSVILAQARVPSDDWWQAPLDLGALTLADVDLNLAGHSLVYGNWRVEDPAIAAEVKDGALSLSRLSGGVLGGSIEASGSVAAGAFPAPHLRVALKDVDLKQALEELAGLRAIDGRLDGAVDIASQGASPADILAHLAGDAALRAHDGHITGVDLVAVDDRLSVPTRPPDLLSLLRSGAGGQTAFSTLAGSFHIADGAARSDDLRLSTEGGEGRATARLDLRQGTLASTIELHFPSIAHAPPLVLMLDGPIAEPRLVFQTSALQRFLDQHQPR